MPCADQDKDRMRQREAQTAVVGLYEHKDVVRWSLHQRARAREGLAD